MSELNTTKPNPTTPSYSPSSRAVVCCFCGLAMPYDGQSPPENVMSEAMEHEKTCILNPYLETIAKLHEAIRGVKDSRGRWNSEKTHRALYSLLPENDELSGDRNPTT